ncbi:MAG: acetyl-CoA carboxylase biotin carboxyl carrier protein [Gemmatimonadetes bacterium]|nr:acetyl-CoA carboxylase biotin carboxyl carrier protein [Gemmatimonadota bacterium]
MIDLEFLESLIRAIDESSLDSIEIERGGTRVRLSKTPPSAGGAGGAVAYGPPAPATPATAAPATAAPAAAPEPEAAAADDLAGLLEVKSPMVGTFYRAPAPDAPSYVDVGDRVKAGDTLCIIEAMKLMNELESEVEGTIVEVLVDNADPVEYGQVLFRVKP